MTDYTPDDLAQEDAGYWAILKQIRLQAGQFTFKDFEYQIEPMGSSARRICYLKARQSFGATIIEVLKDLHGMIMGKYKMGVAHMFPTNDEVGEFSKSIFKPLIANNKLTIGKFVKNMPGSTDTTSLKKVLDAMLWLRGTRLSQKVGDSEESTSSKTAGFSCDKEVFDEVDFMSPEAIVKYLQAMAMSPHKHEVYLGNPSHEDFGIDLIFKQSDQRYWWRKCPSCGRTPPLDADMHWYMENGWTCAEKSFPKCVKMRKDGTGYIGCDKCGKEVLMWAGEGSARWVADFPSKSKYMHGYMASQLMTPSSDPAEVLEAFENPPFGNLADVYRLRLGRPYSNKDEKLRKGDVLACCGNDAPAMRHSGPCAMGVDVGKIKHVVIGTKVDNKRFEIVKACKVPEGATGWQQIAGLAKRYNVKSTVIDIGPYYDEARAYQRACSQKVFLCDTKDIQVTAATFNDNTGVVKAGKTEMFDGTHRLLSTGNIILPSQCPETEEFARQCCNCARFEEKDKRRGTIVFRYRPTGDRQDHFRCALNFFHLAASGHRVGVVPRHKTQGHTEVDNSYDRT